MSKIAIAKAKHFINNRMKYYCDYDMNYSDGEEFDFSNHNKSYYVYLDGEANGCFGCEGRFYSKKEITKLIDIKMSGIAGWDNIVIFDIKQNKIVKPKI
jgi:hypothetical protein